jgi:hypothetical protein
MGSGGGDCAMTSPSQRIVFEAARESEVTDASGRVLRIRRPGALDRLRLFKAVGPGLASNERYVGYAMLAMCVTSIDGIPQPAPINEGQLEALVQRLGDPGMVAIGQELANAERGNQ